MTIAMSGLERRNLWLDGLMARVPQVAANGTFVADLLREIVGEPALVHSSYYLSADNVARDARFLVNRH